MKPAAVGLLLVVVVWAAFWTLSPETQTTGRWILHSSTYKKQLLALPPPTAGYLRHIEWDGWGFAGVGNTVVYLVYDPTRRLGNADAGRDGVRPGLPCEVNKIRELEPGWYTVLFYAMTTWSEC